MTNCWGVLEQWSLQFKIIVNRATNANGDFQQIKQNQEGWSNSSYSSWKVQVLKFIFTHTFLVLVAVGLGHGVYRKLYTLIGGQRAETFENHCSRPRLAEMGLETSLETPSLGVEAVKRFVNVHLHCNVSNLKKISKMSTLPPWTHFCGHPWLL